MYVSAMQVHSQFFYTLIEAAFQNNWRKIMEQISSYFFEKHVTSTYPASQFHIVTENLLR